MVKKTSMRGGLAAHPTETVLVKRTRAQAHGSQASRGLNESDSEMHAEDSQKAVIIGRSRSEQSRMRNSVHLNANHSQLPSA